MILLAEQKESHRCGQQTHEHHGEREQWDGPGDWEGQMHTVDTVHEVDRASLMAQLAKNPPAAQDAQVRLLGQEYPREKGQGTHRSVRGLPS